MGKNLLNKTEPIYYFIKTCASLKQKKAPTGLLI